MNTIIFTYYQDVTSHVIYNTKNKYFSFYGEPANELKSSLPTNKILEHLENSVRWIKQ